MTDALYISHPEVVTDPATSVPRWHPTDAATARVRRFAAVLHQLAVVWASTECKAIEAVGLLAARFSLGIHGYPGLDEIDRSSTGCLPHAGHDRAADALFAHPEISHRGWECAIDVQARAARTWSEIMEASPPGLVAIVGQGSAGTLLLCRLAAWPIDRRHDAPQAGCVWIADLATGAVRRGWRPLERIAAQVKAEAVSPA